MCIIKKAFTLSEVLVTLTIIGIVASMTVPNLIMGYQKIQTVAKLKKTHSVLQQALKLSQNENGDITYWNTGLTGKNFLTQYLKDYLKVVNEYSSAELSKLASRKNLNGSNYVGKVYNNANSYHYLLADGSIITMHQNGSNENGLWVGIDINGLAQPNQIGKDTFLFFLSNEYGLRALGDKGTPSSWSYGDYSRKRVGPTGQNSHSCNKTQQGYWCSALIINDGWQMASDYPFGKK